MVCRFHGHGIFTPHTMCVKTPPTGSVPVLPVLKNGIWKVLEGSSMVDSERLSVPCTFQQYVLSLPLWEQELLKGLTTSHSMEAASIMLQSTPALMCASDGSVIGKTATYSWIIATKNRQRIFKCNGPAPGWKPNSFRAEAYGLLSLTIFLQHLSTYTGQQINTPTTVLIDNKALIKRMQRHQHHKWANPHSCLVSD
jgi:hypothetical protein